ncbi:MAG: hypothetical protein GY820_01585, partial [Gammaproteobacteria bacterium]|nr:hypothetical protein [Gammaproteobacteria bacterium]
DAADRLKNYTVNGSTDSVFTEYTYEAYNRKTEDVTKNGIRVKARIYNYENNTDRLRNVDHTDWVETIDNTDPDNPKIIMVPVPKTIGYTWDSNGNMLTRSDSSEPLEYLTFNYDTRDRLVQTTRGPREVRLCSANMITMPEVCVCATSTASGAMLITTMTAILLLKNAIPTAPCWHITAMQTACSDWIPQAVHNITTTMHSEAL